MYLSGSFDSLFTLYKTNLRMDWIVLLPPIIAIILALWTRQVYLSLLTGLFFGAIILAGGNPIIGLRELVDQLVAVFADEGNTRIVFFCLLVGGLIALLQASGGVSGFVRWAQQRGWGTSRRGAEVLAWVVGMLIFVESSISPLTVGAVSRPFFDSLKLPREKLAYYCDATSAPVCMAIPLNGWGAYLLGLLAAQGMTTGAVSLLAKSLLFNFYSYLTIIFTLLLAISGWCFGPMRVAEERAAGSGALTRPGSQPMVSEEVACIQPESGTPHHVRDLFVPMFMMVVMIFVSLFVTGNGNLMDGSGSTSVLWAVGSAIGVGMLFYAFPRPIRGGKPVLTPSQSMDWIMKGSAGLVGPTVLIIFAFALGQVSRELEMGPYLVGLIGGGGPTWWMPALIFIVACFVSFTMGSSWTGFAVLIPIVLPLAEGLGISPALLLGAVLSGGVYGDHASPLSDTTIISSMSAACDHVDHVNTQLPYTLLLASLTFVAFVIAGLVL